MHYYSHHIGDFIRDTSRLDDSQTMAYLRLMWLYYESEKPLPNKPNVLALKIGSSAENVSLILEAFFHLDGDEWKHTRCEHEIAGYEAIRNRNATNGKAGGRPKKTQWVSTGNPDVTQTEPHRNPNQYPVSSIHKPVTNKENKDKEKTLSAENPPTRFDPKQIQLPECIPLKTWCDWIDYRRKIKSTTNEKTMLLQISELKTWFDEGEDPNRILITSMANGWKGLFKPKNKIGTGIGIPRDNSADSDVVDRIFAERARDMGVIEHD